MKLFFLFVITGLLSAVSFAQTDFIVKGKVINETSGLPMLAASVFAQNTTIGTATDNEGNFVLQLPAGGYDLIVTYTGYQTVSRRISYADAGEKLLISMKPKEKELETVSIIATNEVADGLTKYGSFFYEEFIGKSGNSKQCRIQNPEVLHFFFSKKKNKLKVTATVPLIIKNTALGYNIKYTLDSFSHEYNTEVSTYTGYPLFEEMEGDSTQKRQWKTARRAAYKGSSLHFMRSVFNKTLTQEGFEIQFIVKADDKDAALKIQNPYRALNYSKEDSAHTVEIIPNQKDVGVLFSGEKPSAAYLKENPAEPVELQFSMLSFKPNESIIIEENGYFYDQNDLSVSGYWTWDKVADQVPYDFRYTE